MSWLDAIIRFITGEPAYDRPGSESTGSKGKSDGSAGTAVADAPAKEAEKAAPAEKKDEKKKDEKKKDEKKKAEKKEEKAKEEPAAANTGKDALMKVKGVSASRADLLLEAGFNSPADIAAASAADLSKVKGIGKKSAETLISEAKKVA